MVSVLIPERPPSVVSVLIVNALRLVVLPAGAGGGSVESTKNNRNQPRTTKGKTTENNLIQPKTT